MSNSITWEAEAGDLTQIQGPRLQSSTWFERNRTEWYCGTGSHFSLPEVASPRESNLLNHLHLPCIISILKQDQCQTGLGFHCIPVLPWAVCCVDVMVQEACPVSDLNCCGCQWCHLNNLLQAISSFVSGPLTSWLKLSRLPANTYIQTNRDRANWTAGASNLCLCKS